MVLLAVMHEKTGLVRKMEVHGHTEGLVDEMRKVNSQLVLGGHNYLTSIVEVAGKFLSQPIPACVRVGRAAAYSGVTTGKPTRGTERS